MVPGGTGCPTSTNICPSPARATWINIFAGWLLSFLNECGVRRNGFACRSRKPHAVARVDEGRDGRESSFRQR